MHHFFDIRLLFELAIATFCSVAIANGTLWYVMGRKL